MNDASPAREPALSSTRRRSLGFLVNVPFSPEATGGISQGLEEAIELFQIAEQLGYDSGWVRDRHFDNYLSSPLTFLTAAGRATSRIRLGTAIITVGYEDPIRLAEDASVVDLLTSGRLELGIGRGFPKFAEAFGDATEGWFNRAQAKITRLLDLLDGVAQGKTPDGTELVLRPRSADLRDRVWYGPGGVDTAKTAGAQGLDLLLSTIAPNLDLPFDEAQLAQVHAHRDAWKRTDRGPRITASRLFFPTTNERQRQLYQAYADERLAEGPAASRPVGALPPGGAREAAVVPHGAPGIVSPVHVGSPDQIIAELSEDVALAEADELLIFLPPGFRHEDNVELLRTIAAEVAGPLGWQSGASE